MGPLSTDVLMKQLANVRLSNIGKKNVYGRPIFAPPKPLQITSQFNTSPYRASYYEFCFRVKLWKTWAKVNFLCSIHCFLLRSPSLLKVHLKPILYP